MKSDAARKEAERQQEEKRAAEERRIAALEEEDRKNQEIEREKQRIARICDGDQNTLHKLTSTLQAAARRSVDRSRIGLPPGGGRGPPSRAQSASRISSMVTGAFSPTGARSEGQDAMADASEAHEARMARFSPRLRPG